MVKLISAIDLVLGGIRSRARRRDEEMPREKFVGPTWQRGEVRRVLRAFGAV